MSVTDISRILLYMVGCVFTNNLVFTKLLGSPALHKKTGNIGVSAIVGAFIALVMTVASPLNWLVNRCVLAPLHLSSLSFIAFVLVIAGVAALAGAIMKKIIPAAGEALGDEAISLAASCVVMGVSIYGQNGGLAGALAKGLFGGLGFLLAMVLMAGVQDRLESSKIPKAMKGLPITLVSASLIALAFMGFMGL